MTEQEYRDYPAIAQSDLKAFLAVNKEYIPEKKELESDGLTLGTIVDKLLSESDYNPLDEYQVVSANINFNDTDATTTMIKYLIENPFDYPKDNLDEYMHRHDIYYDLVSEQLDLWKNIKDKIKRKAKWNNPEFELKYKLAKLKYIDKVKVIERDELNLAYTMANTIKTHHWTKDLFEEKEGVEIIFQKKIIFEINGVKCKAMLDYLRIDHNNKTIEVKDFKTSASGDFMSSYYKYGYDLQALFYIYAITYWIEYNEIYNFDNYELLPFEFIVINRINPLEPQIYIDDNESIMKSGIKFDVPILLKEYQWHLDNPQIKISKEKYENNGRIRIKKPEDILFWGNDLDDLNVYEKREIIKLMHEYGKQCFEAGRHKTSFKIYEKGDPIWQLTYADYENYKLNLK